MASNLARLKIFKYSYYKSSNLLIRNFKTSTMNMEKAVEKLKTNPYFDKYAARIAELQKTSPEEFMQRVEQHEKLKETERKKKFASVDTRQYSSVLNPKETKPSNTAQEEKKLDDILKIELMTDKNSAEIKSMWEEYHCSKEVIAACIDVGLYKDIQQYMRQYPTFLFPLPREQGFEFFLCQSFGNSLHFTPLLAYQVHKENAPECLTIMHYTELQEKGIILMRGDYDNKVLSGKEAQCLANQFQLYYNGHSKHKITLLQKFSQQPDSFKHMDLIAELQNIALPQ